jgi:hypothetical protein
MIRITEITLINRNNLLITKITLNNFFIDLFSYEMIKYQLNITLYEKISLHSIRFDISLSQALFYFMFGLIFRLIYILHIMNFYSYLISQKKLSLLNNLIYL